MEAKSVFFGYLAVLDDFVQANCHQRQQVEQDEAVSKSGIAHADQIDDTDFREENRYNQNRCCNDTAFLGRKRFLIFFFQAVIQTFQ